MVMETPSPQCVGREFVRQYYTLLNKAPLHLHRFYSENSSFLHGGIDRPGQEIIPVVGQREIHQKIMQLNFKDCHAKIRQVDSHETLGDGVVVQVTGELSNNGQPMRRFMQTFVLAPQSPKKYYVRNDIFRYQDEIFTDDDETENDNVLADTDTEEVSQKQVSNALQDNENTYYEHEIVRNGSVHVSETLNKYMPPQQQVDAGESPQPEVEVESPKSEWGEEDEDEEEEDEDEEEELEESGLTIGRTADNNTVCETENTPVVSQEPKTYANMVSSSPASAAFPLSGGGGSTATSPVSSQLQGNKNDQAPIFHKQDVNMANAGHITGTPQAGPPSFASQPPRPRINSARGMPMNRYEMRDNTARSPEDLEGEKRKPMFHYPDEQQLFVGNLTHTITEEDLKGHFAQYGNVLDMRINTKQPQKPTGGKVPNFGFIVFENPESVHKVLLERPIFFHEHRLNVEAKKKPRDNRMPPGDNRMGRGGLPPRGIGMGNRGGHTGMMGAPGGAGRGDNRGRMKNFIPRR